MLLLIVLQLVYGALWLLEEHTSAAARPTLQLGQSMEVLLGLAHLHEQAMLESRNNSNLSH